MKYLILLIAMLTTVAEAKEPVSPPIWVQDIANVGIGIAIVVFFPVVMILYMAGNGPC